MEYDTNKTKTENYIHLNKKNNVYGKENLNMWNTREMNKWMNEKRVQNAFKKFTAWSICGIRCFETFGILPIM